MSAATLHTTDAKPATKLFRNEYGHFVGGNWVRGETGRLIDQINPATGEVLASIQAGSPLDATRAVEAARSADYALMESLNNGKTITEASYWDIPNTIATFNYFAGAAHTLHGETRDYPDAIAITHREPIGVCAQIIPWNVPLLMAAAKIAPAIVAGNTVVLKPAETTCLAVLEFINAMADIIPPGVVNVVTGFGSEIGEALVTHRDVRKVAFTGSTVTGRRIMQYASQNLIPQTLELGGKSAQIVCESADIDSAVEGVAAAAFGFQGQKCSACSRAIIDERIYDTFLEKLKARVEKIQVGDPAENANMAAVINEGSMKSILQYIEQGRKDGRVITGGGRASNAGEGYFIQPTVIADIPPKSKLVASLCTTPPSSTRRASTARAKSRW